MTTLEMWREVFFWTSAINIVWLAFYWTMFVFSGDNHQLIRVRNWHHHVKRSNNETVDVGNILRSHRRCIELADGIRRADIFQ